MSARRRFIVKAVEDHGSSSVLATSIMVDVPSGLTRQQAVDFVTGLIAREVSRYFAYECLGIAHDHPIDWTEIIT